MTALPPWGGPELTHLQRLSPIEEMAQIEDQRFFGLLDEFVVKNLGPRPTPERACQPPWGEWAEPEPTERIELKVPGGLPLPLDYDFDQKRPVHVSRLVEALCVGIVRADVFHWGYQLPPHFEKVVNYFASRIYGRFEKQEVVELSLNEYKQMLRGFGAECAEYLAWNEWPAGQGKTHQFTSRYDATPDKRDFIDLGALVGNAAVYLRDQWRLEDDFELRFSAQQARLAEQLDPYGE